MIGFKVDRMSPSEEAIARVLVITTSGGTMEVQNQDVGVDDF